MGASDATASSPKLWDLPFLIISPPCSLPKSSSPSPQTPPTIPKAVQSPFILLTTKFAPPLPLQAPNRTQPNLRHALPQLDILLPTPIYTLLSPTLPQQCPTLANPPSYRRLIIPLGAILESEFFNTHIKKGNIILISKGQLDTDDLFTLCDGVLRMILNNESYERAGIQGRPAQWGNGPGLAKRRRFGMLFLCRCRWRDDN